MANAFKDDVNSDVYWFCQNLIGDSHEQMPLEELSPDLDKDKELLWTFESNQPSTEKTDASPLPTQMEATSPSRCFKASQESGRDFISLFGALPLEMQAHILQHIPPKELFLTLGVCKGWQLILEQDLIWEFIYKTYFGGLDTPSDFTDELIEQFSSERLKSLKDNTQQLAKKFLSHNQRAQDLLYTNTPSPHSSSSSSSPPQPKRLACWRELCLHLLLRTVSDLREIKKFLYSPLHQALRPTYLALYSLISACYYGHLSLLRSLLPIIYSEVFTPSTSLKTLASISGCPNTSITSHLLSNARMLKIASIFCRIPSLSDFSLLTAAVTCPHPSLRLPLLNELLPYLSALDSSPQLLWWAVVGGSIDVIQFIMSSPPNLPFSGVWSQWTPCPIHAAVRLDDLPIARLLVGHIPPRLLMRTITYQRLGHKNTLMHDLDSGEMTDLILGRLKEAKVDFSVLVSQVESNEKASPMNTWAERGKFDVFRTFLKYAPECSVQKPVDATSATTAPATLAAKHGHIEMMKLVADPTDARQVKWLLLTAANARQVKTLACILDWAAAKGSALEKKTNWMRHLELVLNDWLADTPSEQRKLCEISQAYLDHDDGLPSRCLHIAIRRKFYAVMELLLDHGMSPEIQDEAGNTPLHECREVEPVKALLKRVGEERVERYLNWANFKGKTPLHAAAQRGNVNVVIELGMRGAKMDLVDEDGNTAMHVAVKSAPQKSCREYAEYVEVVRWLKKCGASESVVNNEGLRASELLEQKTRKELEDKEHKEKTWHRSSRVSRKWRARPWRRYNGKKGVKECVRDYRWQREYNEVCGDGD